MLSETLTPVVDFFVQRLDIEDDIDEFADDVVDAAYDLENEVDESDDDDVENENSFPDDKPDELGDVEDN